MKPTLTLLACAAAALSVACGSLDGHTGTPSTLVTVHGEMTNSTNLSLTAPVRVAVVWLGSGPVGTAYNVAQDLPVQPVFPSNFVIHLDEPPPASALGASNQGYQFQMAQGFVVAYEDLNGNGKLDLVQNDAGAFVDKIVGVNPQGTALIYLQGTLPSDIVDSDGKRPSLGYGLYTVKPCPGGDGGVERDDAGRVQPCAVTHWSDMSSPYDLEISDDPENNQMTCADYGISGSASMGGGASWSVDTQGTPPDGYPAPGADGLTCMGTTSYEYSQCQVIHNGLCDEVNSCLSLSVSLGNAPAPAGWPCP
jgi:hypothetical protein